MVLNIYIPPKQEEKCKMVVSFCKQSNVSISRRVQMLINKIYVKEIETIEEANDAAK